MKIALVNNRYFMVGGTTRYLFNVERLLADRGHEVIPFSNRYSRSEPTPWLDHFVEPAGGDAHLFRDLGRSLSGAAELFVRGAYDREVKSAFRRLIRDSGAEIAYSVNICNYIGPSVIDAAHDEGIPYVMRLSDFNLLCPAYTFMRDGAVCTECRGGLHHAIRHRCLQGRLSVSAARVAQMWVHRLSRVYHRVDAIVTPTVFLRDQLVNAGYPPERIHHVPSFAHIADHDPLDDWSSDELVYSGRISPEKGCETLIDAIGRLPHEHPARLVLVGDGHEDYVARLRERAGRVAAGRVEFTGFLDDRAHRERLRNARAVALAARWFENLPNSITEAMALARPVIASDLGSLPEQVVHGSTGLLVPADSVDAWVAAIGRLWSEPGLARTLGAAGRARAMEIHGPERHYDSLVRVFAAAARTRTSRGAR